MTEQIPLRDLMSPDTEPTDKELQLVMREALALAMERKKQSDNWMKQELWRIVTLVRKDFENRQS